MMLTKAILVKEQEWESDWLKFDLKKKTGDRECEYKCLFLGFLL